MLKLSRFAKLFFSQTRKVSSATVSVISLDPNFSKDTTDYVTNLQKTGLPSDMCKENIYVMRKQLNEAAQKDIQLSALEKEILISEFSVKRDNYDIAVTQYSPRKPVKNAPITVFYHGGGWTLGSRLTHHMSLASLTIHTQAVWLSVEYRLSPDVKFPVPLDDCKCVTEYVLANKTQFSTPNAKVGVAGDNSGGNFAAVIAQELRDKLDYQILLYPCVNLAYDYPSYHQYTDECYVLVPQALQNYRNNYLNNVTTEVTLPRVSPILMQNLRNLPKCLLVAAELDPFVDEGKAYADLLVRNHVECQRAVVRGTIHGFFRHPMQLSSAFNETIKRINDFLNINYMKV